MAKFRVTTPDGKSVIVEAPDAQAANDQVTRGVEAMREQDAGPDPLFDAVRAVPVGIARGASEAAQLPVTIGRGIASGRQWVGDRFQDLLGVPPDIREKGNQTWDRQLGQGINDTQDTVRGAINNFLPKAATGVGQAVENVASFLPGALLGPGSLMGKLTKFGVLPGVASEAAGQVTKGSAVEPYARAGAGLLTGGAAALVGRPSPAMQVLRQQLPKGATANDLAAADSLIQQNRRMGIDTFWPEALAQVTNGRVDITDVQRILEQSKGSRAVMNEALAKRPAQLQAAMNAAAPKLGPLADPVVAGLRVQRISNDAITNLRQRINRATERLYQQGGQQMVDPLTYANLAKDPRFQTYLKRVRTNPDYLPATQGFPDQSVQVLNEIKKLADADATAFAAAPGKMGLAARRGGIASGARDASTAASPEYLEALQRQSRYRQNVLEPAQAGPLGKMAGTNDLGGQIDALLTRAPLEGSEHVVKQTVLRLARQDPAAAGNLVRAHVVRVFDEAMGKMGLRRKGWGGAQFVHDLAGNSQQGRNLEAAIRALPDGAARWEGFKHLLTTMETTGWRQQPGSATAFNAQFAEQAARGGAVGTAASLAGSPGSILTYLRDRYLDFRFARNNEQMARMLTDPASGPLFQKLLSARTTADRTRAAAALLYSVEETAQGRRGGQPLGPLGASVPALPAP